jgi:S-adenosylmethionine hydrolase
MIKNSAPMFVLFTDFGSDGPYVGQMKAVLAQQAPDIPVIDLLHVAPRFKPQASAHLLAAYVSAFPKGSVVLGVVDPGVGSVQRKPVVAKISGRWFIGPANGLFDVLAARAVQVGEKIACWEISWQPENLSNSFHGRDLFAPVAARLAQGEAPPGEPMDWPLPATAAADFPEIIFIDHFGNAITGLRTENVDADTRLEINGRLLVCARTFSEVAVGQAFWYKNANGLVEIAVNQGDAACELSITIGSCVEICK